MSAPAPRPRQRPKQLQSREIVDAIVRAGRELLAEQGPRALTTNRISERAGVSIGSLYRHFTNKEAVLAAIYDASTEGEVRDLHEAPRWEADDRPLHEVLVEIVDFHVERQQRVQARDPIDARGGRDVETQMRALLERHAGIVRVRDFGHAAFFLARGLAVVVRRALEERPEMLDDASFRTELVDLLSCYLTSEQARR